MNKTVVLVELHDGWYVCTSEIPTEELLANSEVSVTIECGPFESEEAADNHKCWQCEPFRNADKV